MGTELAAVGAPASVSFEQMQRLAKSVAASKLFGVKNEDEAMALMMIAQAEGRHPALAVRDYHIISGKPSLKADTMLARFQAAGGKVDWKKYTDTECVGVFSHPQSGSVTVEWTFERARQIGLTSKDVWKHYARAMLRARCISEGVRTCYPGIAVGIYTPEEIQDEVDITPARTEQARETQQTQAVQSIATALTAVEIDEHILAMDVQTLPELLRAFEAAWNHAKQAKDKSAADRFKAVYDLARADIDSRKPKDDLI